MGDVVEGGRGLLERTIDASQRLKLSIMSAPTRQSKQFVDDSLPPLPAAYAVFPHCKSNHGENSDLAGVRL